MKQAALALMTLTALMASSPALAQRAAPAPTVTVPAATPAPVPAPPPSPVPPGEGMIDQPCPPQQGLFFASPYVRQYDWAWLCRYREANRQITAPPRVVFIGDSITENWTAQDKTLFSNGIVGRGISGQTSPQILLRFMQDVVQLRPRVVHIMIGTNDLAGNTGPNSPDQYRANIRAMVDLARANGIAVILGSIPPAARFPWRPAIQPAARIIELNIWLRLLAQERGLVFADYHATLATPQGAIRPGLATDGVHPNAQGYALMLPVAQRAIAEAERKAP